MSLKSVSTPPHSGKNLDIKEKLVSMSAFPLHQISILCEIDYFVWGHSLILSLHFPSSKLQNHF
jgi:hypothetical protein